MIKGVIFDLGWTLMYYDSDWKQVGVHAYQALGAFLRAQGLALGDDFLQALHAERERGWKLADETGVERTVEDALRVVLVQFGYAANDSLVPRAVERYFAVHEPHWLAYPDALETLRALHARGLRLGLFSNADDDGLVRRCVARFGFAPYLDPVLSSAMPHRLRKPDPRALRLIADAWQIAPSEIVMVGDSPPYDILGAHRAGMCAILTDRGDGSWWQKIPEDRANDPTLHADAVVKTLAEIPKVIEKL